jgi:hypothetical protein
VHDEWNSIGRTGWDMRPLLGILHLTLSDLHHIKYVKRHMFGILNANKNKKTNYMIVMAFAKRIF